MFEKNLILSQFIKLIEERDEIKIKEEIVDGKILSIVSYIIVKNDTFETPLSREVRGLVFDKKTGSCLSRPFHKFFNVDENQFSLRENIDWENAFIGTKHDGSMAIPVVINGKIFWKTKKSFYSDVAIKINQFWNNEIKQKDRQEIANKIWRAYEHGNTLIYEFVAPNNRIVLKYDKTNLIYLAERNIETGEYIHYHSSKVNSIDIKYSYPEIGEDNISLNDFIDKVKTMEEIEGFVISDKKDFYKIKTDWYFSRHKVISGLSGKFIVYSTLNEEIDDIIGFIKQMKIDDLAKEVEIERDKVINEYLTKYNFSHNCFKDLKHIKDRKKFAEEVLTTKYKALSPYLFKLFDGRPIEDLIKKSLKRDLPKLIRNLGIGG